MKVTRKEWEANADARSSAARGSRQDFEALFAWIWSWTVSRAGGEDQALDGWIKIIRNPALWLKPLPYFASIFEHVRRDSYRQQLKNQELMNAAAYETVIAVRPEARTLGYKKFVQKVLGKLSSDYQLTKPKHRTRIRTPPGGADIRDLAMDIFGTKTLAKAWLTEPNLATDNKPPIELLKTRAGIARVKMLLQRIDYGVLT